MSNLHLTINWSPNGDDTQVTTITCPVKDVDLNDTRVAFTIPEGEEHTVIRVHNGRLYRQMNLPEAIDSSKSILEEARTEALANMKNGFLANGLLWVPCAEPGYAISRTDDSVKIHTVIPMPGHYPELFSLRDLHMAKAEALEIALDHKLVDSIPSILGAPEAFIADGARVSRLTQAEKLQARAERLEAALAVAEEVASMEGEQLDCLLELPR